MQIDIDFPDLKKVSSIKVFVVKKAETAFGYLAPSVVRY
jgi:hypothetical protein